MFDHYYDHSEVQAFLQDLAERFPHLVTLSSIGRTYEGREILLATVTDRQTDLKADQKPALAMDGCIHASEVTSTLAVLHTLEKLTEGFGSDPQITELLTANTVYAIPMINADGAERFLKTPGRVRGSVEPFYPEAAGIHPADVDGDGEILQMRIPDPCGRWKISDFDPRVMEERQPNDIFGTYYTVVPEGLVKNGDLVCLQEAPPREGLDPNRQFPFDWSPSVPDETGQNTSGPAPLHDVEVQALFGFIQAHPNIAFEMNYHTFGGLHISPLDFCPREKPESEDAMCFQKLGQMFHDLTGYQVEGIFPPGAMDIAHGSYTTYLFWTLGIPAYVTELWDFHRQAYPDRPESWSMFFTSCREQFVQENQTQLKWDEEHNDGQGFVDWHPFRHPQLGDVELGGWKEKFTKWNPPLRHLPGVLDKAWAVSLASLSILPRLELRLQSCHLQEDGFWRLELLLANTGFLPSATRQAVLHGYGSDLRLTCTNADRTVTKQLNAVDGFSKQLVSLTVAGKAGDVCNLTLSSRRAGTHRLQVTLHLSSEEV